MADKRTRKQKESAHHNLYSWTPNSTSQARVKRESKIEAKADYALVTAKKDIIRSLALSSLILGMEVVLYLGWNRFMP